MYDQHISALDIAEKETCLQVHRLRNILQSFQYRGVTDQAVGGLGQTTFSGCRPDSATHKASSSRYLEVKGCPGILHTTFGSYHVLWMGLIFHIARGYHYRDVVDGKVVA